MQLCRSCGNANPNEAKRCQKCNTELVAAKDRHTFFLVGKTGKFRGNRVEVPAAGLIVGRQPNASGLLLEDSEVSRTHARVFISDAGELRVADSSSNGTFLNGQRIGEESVVHGGDSIRFGLNPECTFEVEEIVPQVIPMQAAAAAGGGKDVTRRNMTMVMPAAPKMARDHMQTIMMKADEAMSAPRCRLQLVVDQHTSRDVAIEGRLELGSEEGPGKLAVQHASISHKHAAVEVKEGKASLRDLGSTNGTFVNGERIDERKLEDGDLIQLGACESQLLIYREARRRATVLKDVRLDQPLITIGRDPANNVHIDHPTISSNHAEIRKFGDSVQIIDKSSTNGTFVNGHKVISHTLKPHDRIALGAVELVFDGSQLGQTSDGRVRVVASNITCSAQDAQTGKTIKLIDDISLVFEPCEFVGLLGPSGAGKSTLMDALNGSRPASQGEVKINRWNLYQQFDSLRAMVGHVPQEDILHRGLTVHDSLFYSGRLRLPDDYKDKEIEQRVADVVRTLDLKHRIDTPVAMLSGGERKRVSLGIELLSKPSILFVDEPTAGQDPRTEMRMMQLFREIANRNATVVINTHLLGSVSLLDKVAVVVRGKLAYFGPGQEMLPFFKASRPVEVFDKLQEKSPEQWSADYRKSDLYREFIVDPQQQDAAKSQAEPAAAAETGKSKARHSALRQLSTLLARQFTLKVSDISSAAVALLPAVIVGALLGGISRAANEPKTLFMMIIVAMWLGCSAAVREFVDERAVYKRERQRDLKRSSYLVSKLAFAAVLGVVQSVLFLTTITLMGAQSGHFPEALAFMSIMSFHGALIGLLISGLAKSPEQALYWFPIALIPQLLLAGLLVPVNPIHPFYPDVNTQENTVTIKEPPKMFVPEPMGSALRYGLAPAIVARWGLEGLTDVYIHDYPERTRAYAYAAMNSISISLHPQDAENARKYLETFGQNSKVQTFGPQRPAIGSYMGILSGAAGLMIVFVGLALIKNEH